MDSPEPDVLADAAACVWVGTRQEAKSKAGARAYLDDGRAVVWSPVAFRGRVAVDAERRRAPPVGVAGYITLAEGHDFWARWTRLEVHCKLTDTPVIDALRGVALPVAARGHRIRTAVFDVDDVVVCCGVAEPVLRGLGS